MINLDDIKGRSAHSLLEKYDGINPYLLKLKHQCATTKISLTETQIRYIIENVDKEPLLLKRIVGVTKYLGEELQKQENLKFTPEKIYIEFLLAETEKAFHIYGKVKQNQDSKMYWLPKTQVLDDPYFEKIQIDVDFTKYNNILAKQNKKLYAHQEDGVKFLLSRKGAILGDLMGLGKGVTTNTLIYTPTGIMKIGNLKINDKVIGSNGLPCNVIGVYPQGVKDIYRVTFNDGYYILCDNEHLWSVSSSNNGINSNSESKASVFTLSTEQMLDKNSVIERNGIGHNSSKIYKIKTYYKQDNGNNKWQIPIVKAIEFNNNHTLPIEPYLLGLSLGDGHIKKSSVYFTIHTNDFDEIFENYNIKEGKSKNNCRSVIINMGDLLKQLKLDNTRSHTKFIPEIYKFSSINDRIALLQGLMDTDGHCMKGKSNIFQGTEYCTVSEQLANDVAEIVHSLGGIVRMKSKIGSYKNKDGVKVICKKAYRLNIKMPEGINPFRLKRKADLYNSPQKYKIGRYISDIKYEKQDESVCIAVDAPDKLYVVEHGIVTHNTTQAIVAALEKDVKNILIVCPSAVKINWEREIHNFECYDTHIVEGGKWHKAKFTIINFDILKNFHTIGDEKKLKQDDPYIEINRELVNAKFDLCIIDEAHNLKNKNSIRGDIMADLCVNYGVDTVWLLTGTPVANRPMDYYNLLKLIKSPIANNWKFFVQRYCEGKQFFKKLKNGKKKKIWLTNGASNLDELAQKTKNVFLRRLKTEISDMPDKVVSKINHKLSLEGAATYEELWENYLIKRKSEGKKGEPDKALVEIGLLRKFIAMQMVPKTIDLINDVIDDEKKIVIFTTFTDELNELAEYYGDSCVTHNGQMTDKEKQESIDTFQNNSKVRIFIGNIKSAGVGITLTESSVVIFNSFDWVPGNNEQAEDRCHRIGQKQDVNVYYQLFEDTISLRMWETINYKQKIISKIINDTSDEREVITLLLDEIVNKSQ